MARVKRRCDCKCPDREQMAQPEDPDAERETDSGTGSGDSGGSGGGETEPPRRRRRRKRDDEDDADPPLGGGDGDTLVLRTDGIESIGIWSDSRRPVSISAVSSINAVRAPQGMRAGIVHADRPVILQGAPVSWPPFNADSEWPSSLAFGNAASECSCGDRHASATEYAVTECSAVENKIVKPVYKKGFKRLGKDNAALQQLIIAHEHDHYFDAALRVACQEWREAQDEARLAAHNLRRRRDRDNRDADQRAKDKEAQKRFRYRCALYRSEINAYKKDIACLKKMLLCCEEAEKEDPPCLTCEAVQDMLELAEKMKQENEEKLDAERGPNGEKC